MEGALPPVSFEDLQRQIDHVVGALRAIRVGSTDVVAVAAAPGSAATLAILGAMAAAIAAPLDPYLPAPEATAALRQLGVRALLVDEDESNPVRGEAATLGIPVLAFRRAPSAAARITCVNVTRTTSSTSHPTQDAPALLLRTTGTTGRPKLAALTHGNLVAATRIVAATFSLSPSDRCLNVVPLHTSHGCVSALLASLLAGGSVVCVPMLDEDTIGSEADRHRPTWYTASPAVHEVIHGALERRWDKERRTLRFIRSAGAPLSFRVLTGLEASLGVPVLDAYALTEAPGQVTCNPLPPRRRKPGTVGVPRGCEVGILTERGFAGRDELGEIVVRGAHVISGYWRSSGEPGDVVDGWLRTGDTGFFDEDGYLVITGRLKETINRGGQKVVPAEVEAALLAHVAVREAAVFPVPHPTLGEEVAAVVAVDATVRPAELCEFLSRSLAAFKVPRRIVVTDRVPRGADGKIRRRSLAVNLGLIESRSNPTGTRI
jgi:acyl-CoA synthetase (AMP-forming)/AMP-acid ligase II